MRHAAKIAAQHPRELVQDFLGASALVALLVAGLYLPGLL